MKKITDSLPLWLLLGVTLGITAGQLAGSDLVHAVVTIRYILNQVVVFYVPFIIIGFIAPSITRLGSNASKMLGVVVIAAYTSSTGAAPFLMTAGFFMIPHLSIATEVEGLKDLPGIVFQLDIPQIMPVMNALVFSLPLGLTATRTKATVITQMLEEFQQTILSIVAKAVTPIPPVFVAFTFCALSYEGAITKQLPVFTQVVIIVMTGHYIWPALLYAVGDVYLDRNPPDIMKNYGSAYITMVDTVSSVAILAVTLCYAKKSQLPPRDDTVDFGIPFFANTHLCGSILTKVFSVMITSKILYGAIPSLGTMILLCALLGVFAIGASGVPGDTVMASLDLITGISGFDETGTALMLTISTLQNSFGTACNATGDEALTMILTGFVEKHGIKRQKIEGGL